MSNFELIDDYLSNRLSELDKKAFEQQLNGDPALKSEVELQQRIIKGVRTARAAQLKTMLNNVPVGTSFWSGGKLAATVASVGLVATLVYFYAIKETQTTPSQEQPQQEIIAGTDSVSNTIAETPETITAAPIVQEDAVTTQEPEKEKPKLSTEKKTTTPVHKPSIDVVDPSADMTETTDVKESSGSSRSDISPSKMEVITGVADKKHNFHYQFVKGKLMLFGPFDKSLYEILEIHGEGHAVFLFYKENYYLLNESQSKITELHPISDSQLVKKLKEYRGQ